MSIIFITKLHSKIRLLTERQYYYEVNVTEMDQKEVRIIGL
jgi:hypothetical protein